MISVEPLASKILRHTAGDGVFQTALPGLSLLRSSSPTEPIHTVYRPAACIVAQGRKQVLLGDTSLIYDPAHYLVVGVDLPVRGVVLEASSARPYLCLQLDLSPEALGAVLLDWSPPDVQPTVPCRALGLSRADARLIDAATRLVALLDEPAMIRSIAPLIEAEILHRLLAGEQSDTLRRIGTPDSRLGQAGRAIRWLKDNYASDFRVETLAELSGMSRSTFHQHFRQITSMTPLQYRNQLRLHEARRLMTFVGHDAASAGFQVGYDSPSQFSRDYARLFDCPPKRDATRLQSEIAV